MSRTRDADLLGVLVFLQRLEFDRQQRTSARARFPALASRILFREPAEPSLRRRSRRRVILP